MALLAKVQENRTRLGAIQAKVKAFATRVTTVAAPTGECPLTADYSIEPLTSGATNPWVLVVGPATTETYQMVVSRRMLAARLHVSARVEVDYFLVRGDLVRAAGTSSS